MIAWKEASKELPTENVVLVVFLEPFFGGLNPEITVAQYDDPADYKDGRGEGWKDWYTNKKIRVTHWAPLPGLPESVKDVKKLPTQQWVIDNSVLGTVEVAKWTKIG